MTTYLVSSLQPFTVNFAPATVVEEVLQNVYMIMTTPKYSVPLFREFAANATYLDRPLPVAKAQLAAELATNIPKYEPRAQVKKITWTGDGETGQLVPQAVITIVS
jgi:phage baseplate assembly protein W